MKVFKNIRKNNNTLQILFSWDWHNESTLYCNGFNSLGRTKTFELNSFRIPILLAFFSANSANSTDFRISILFVTEIFLCEAYCFRKTSQTSDAQKNMPLVSIINHDSGDVICKNNIEIQGAPLNNRKRQTKCVSGE